MRSGTEWMSEEALSPLLHCALTTGPKGGPPAASPVDEKELHEKQSPEELRRA